MKTIIIGFIFLLSFHSNAFSGNPTPYTKETYKKIEAEMKKEVKMNESIHDANLSKEESLVKKIELFRRIYARAGYNYDDTIITVFNDMRHHPERIPHNPESVPTMIYIGVHLIMSECNYEKVDCLKFFSPDAAEAINWLIKNTEFKL